LWEFHHIYNFSAVGDKDYVYILRSRGQRSRSQWDRMHFSGGWRAFLCLISLVKHSLVLKPWLSV